MYRALTCGTLILVIRFDINEVAFIEQTIGFVVRSGVAPVTQDTRTPLG